jgi:hypothetical protein
LALLKRPLQLYWKYQRQIQLTQEQISRVPPLEQTLEVKIREQFQVSNQTKATFSLRQDSLPIPQSHRHSLYSQEVVDKERIFISLYLRSLQLFNSPFKTFELLVFWTKSLDQMLADGSNSYRSLKPCRVWSALARVM